MNTITTKPEETPDALRVVGISKRFGATQALEHLDLTFKRGEIHALLGANGAGKSTLIKILSGVYTADEGEIQLAAHDSGQHAARNPMAFIHQDLGLIDWMTVAENIALTTGYPRTKGLIDWSGAATAARQALSAIGSTLSPTVPVSALSAGDRSIVAIARAIAMDPDLLVLDEPTASLPEADVARLFEVLTRLRARSVSIIYITHRLDEVYRIADQVTVLRDGRAVLRAAVSDTTQHQLVTAIVGGEPTDLFSSSRRRPGREILRAEDLVVGNIGPVSFEVREGELLGLCGLRGAGQEVIGRALAGAVQVTGGRLLLEGKEVRFGSPADASDLGFGFMSGKRSEESIASTLTVRENLVLNPALRGRRLFEPRLRRREHAEVTDELTRYHVRPTDGELPIVALSGGNQQKVVLGRLIESARKVMVLEEPTQGVDIGAKAEIYRLIDQTLSGDQVVIAVSSDLEEIVGICDRALVFNRGEIIAEVDAERMSVQELTRLAAGR